MDLVLNAVDHFLHPLCVPITMARRKIISLLLVTNLGAVVLYLGLGWLSYHHFIFDHNLRKLSLLLYLKPVSIPTVAFFLEASSDNVEDAPMDGCIYWIHRVLHHKRIYKVMIIKSCYLWKCVLQCISSSWTAPDLPVLAVRCYPTFPPRHLQPSPLRSNKSQTCSMGLRSGLFADDGRTLTFLSCRKSRTERAVWLVALSC
uniref:Uncharacterized protein n=1 Tax=Oncorhynchus mykiss TaxID=8022 RepID=A0A8C7QQK5_ONCMY